MKLHQSTVLNTCPRRVTIYMAEKALECEVVYVDMRSSEGRSSEFLAKNPNGTVPVLELDNGDFLPDSAAIVEYLEELYPDPPMMGTTPEERAQIRATERMATEFQTRIGYWIVNTDPGVVVRRPELIQYPDVAAFVAPKIEASLHALEQRIGDNPFLAGDQPTVADCELFATLDVCLRLSKYELPVTKPRLQAWFDRFRQRPSAQYPDWATQKERQRTPASA